MRKKAAVTERGGRRLACIVLAAGGSARLGRPKQLVRDRGQPLLVRAAQLARGAVDGRVVVVLGAEHQRLRSLLRRETAGVTTVRNARWRGGLASSLILGLEALPVSASGALILLPDQARVGARDLARLTEGWRVRPRKAAAALYAGRAGAPAIIPRHLFRAAKDLRGDVGARHLLRALGGVTLVPMPSAAFDVDTRADIERL